MKDIALRKNLIMICENITSYCNIMVDFLVRVAEPCLQSFGFAVALARCCGTVQYSTRVPCCEAVATCRWYVPPFLENHHTGVR